MPDAELLDRVRHTPWVAERLMTLADFELERAGNGPVEPCTWPVASRSR